MGKCNQVHNEMKLNFMKIQLQHLNEVSIVMDVFAILFNLDVIAMNLEQMQKKLKVHKRSLMLMKFRRFKHSINYIMEIIKL